MRTVNQQKYAEKRQSILDAAIRCFTRSGIQKTPVSAICAEAGLSAGHLYHYFKSKEEIMVAIVEQALEETGNYFRRMLESGEALGALSAYVERVETFSEEGKHRIILDLFSEAGRNESLALILQTHSERIKALLANVLHEGQKLGQVDNNLNPDTAAEILLAVFDGLKFMPLRHPYTSREVVIEQFQLLIRRFLSVPGQSCIAVKKSS